MINELQQKRHTRQEKNHDHSVVLPKDERNCHVSLIENALKILDGYMKEWLISFVIIEKNST